MAGTDSDPFDPQRGWTYRYMGWFLMHKTPKMIEARVASKYTATFSRFQSGIKGEG